MPRLYVLLTDPEERMEVDGSWAAGLAALASAGNEPLVLTEPRLAGCVRAVAPEARLTLPVQESLCARLGEIHAERSALLELLFLRDRAPGPGLWDEVRSFGLRSAVLGSLLAGSLRCRHDAFMAGPAGVPAAAPGFRERAWRLREEQWRRSVEAWVLSQGTTVGVPDEEAGQRWHDIHLPSPGRIRVASSACDWRQVAAATPGGAGRGPGRVAVLASRLHPASNRRILRALQQESRACGGPAIHWLARRGGPATIRTLQAIRRCRLAHKVRWEEEPWMRPPPLRADRWNLLVLVEARLDHWPLAVSQRAAGGKVVVFRDETSLRSVLRETLGDGNTLSDRCPVRVGEERR